LGVADVVRSCLEDLGVVQTTIDMLRRLVAERSQEKSTQQGTFGWDGQHYRMTKVDDVAASRSIEEAEKALAFAERLTLVPSEAAGGLLAGSKEVFDDCDPCFVDTIYAAQGSERLLLCDDYMFRQLAREAANVEGVWTQPVTLSAAQSGAISGETFCDVVGSLVGADYRFTQIDRYVVLHQLGKDRWENTHTVRRMVNQIAAPSNDAASVERLLADVVQFGWGQAPDRPAYRRFLVTLFRAFRRLQPDRDLVALSAVALYFLRSRLRRNGHQALLKRVLLRTTFHVSAARVISEINANADFLHEEISAFVHTAINIASESEPSA
jgi:cellulose synthase operon protein C